MKLDWNGVESVASDTYHDIMSGYYSGEIKCDLTREELDKAIKTIIDLVIFLEDNDLVT